MRLAKESAKKPDEPDEDCVPELEKMSTDHDNGKCEKVNSLGKSNSQIATNNQRSETLDFPTKTDTISNQSTMDDTSDNCNKLKDASTVNSDESDGLSDIDDVELSSYLNNEEETRRKTAVWEEMNREYLEEQAAKIGNGESAAKPKKLIPGSDKKLNPSSHDEDETQKDAVAEKHESDIMNAKNEWDYEYMNHEYGGETGHENDGYPDDYNESNLEDVCDYGYYEDDSGY